MHTNKATAALLGVAVGDALGVPFEFKSREEMTRNPIRDMVGHGTHNQPEGTWSDDSSLTFCLAESLTQRFDLTDIAQNFIRWKDEAWWSARGQVFDIGKTTSTAITRLKQILASGETTALELLNQEAPESDNGNGSLMRILPLVFYIRGMPAEQQFDMVWKVSALTHRHIRAAMSCFIYLKLAEKILDGEAKETAYLTVRKEIMEFWEETGFPAGEQAHFLNVIQNDIRKLPEKDLKSGGYVIEVLESALWYFLNRSNYESTVLSIINLGHDTDTSAAIAGGLAGLYYGQEGIPDYWIVSLARMEDIFELGERLDAKFPGA